MKTVLEEVTSDAIDAEHVERRVDDWDKRLKGSTQRSASGWRMIGRSVRAHLC